MTIVTARFLILASLAVGFLAACGERDVILPGTREAIRDDRAGFVNQALPVAVPAARANADWTHRNGGPAHQIAHPALGAGLQQVFVADIGAGDSRRARITADPIVSGGMIFTLDAGATVTATTTAGALRWTRDLTPTRDNATDASGGGIAAADGQLYVTTGFGEISALDAATGEVVWVQDLDAPAIAAPTVFDGLVYVVARDSVGWALEPETGRIRWQLTGTPSTANFADGASPAVTSELAVFPFPSGDVIATFPQGGLRRWSTVVSGDRLGRASTLVSDISSDPVIAGDRVYVGNFGGQVVALDLQDGTRIWTAREGAISPVWPVANAIFLVNDLNELVRLDAETGAPVWRVSLPNQKEGLSRRNRAVFAHYGPVLAGGRLIVASSDDVIRQFDPASGALLGTLPLPGGAASNPVIAGQTLYVVSKEGALHAFR